LQAGSKCGGDSSRLSGANLQRAIVGRTRANAGQREARGSGPAARNKQIPAIVTRPTPTSTLGVPGARRAGEAAARGSAVWVPITKFSRVFAEYFLVLLGFLRDYSTRAMFYILTMNVLECSILTMNVPILRTFYCLRSPREGKCEEGSFTDFSRFSHTAHGARPRQGPPPHRSHAPGPTALGRDRGVGAAGDRLGRPLSEPHSEHLAPLRAGRPPAAARGGRRHGLKPSPPL
jgi:hypothetical protein